MHNANDVVRVGYRYNDGGKAEAGYRGASNYCLPIALAIMLHAAQHKRPGEEGYKTPAQLYARAFGATASAMAAGGYIATGNGFLHPDPDPDPEKGERWQEIQRGLLKTFGFEPVKLFYGEWPTYSEAYNTYGPCMVSTSWDGKVGHIVAIPDGRVHDTMDSTTRTKTDWGGREVVWERKAYKVWLRWVTPWPDPTEQISIPRTPRGQLMQTRTPPNE